MEFLINNLGHILALAGLFLTLYTFHTVRRAKFILIRKNFKTIINNNDDFDITYDNERISTKLVYQNFIICYVGASDTKKEDIKIPLTIESDSENLRFIDYKVNKTTKNFNPRIILREKKIVINNDSFQNGDAIDIEILSESNNSILKLNQRFLNVDMKIKEFVDNKENYKDLLRFLFGLIICTILSITIIYEYKYKSDINNYITKFIYNGIEIDEDDDYDNKKIADSLFFIEINKKHPNYNVLNLNVIKKPDSIFKHYKIQDSIYKVKPSVLAEMKFKELVENNQFEYKKLYEINNNIKVSYNSTISTFDWAILIIVFLFFMPSIFFMLFALLSTSINLYYVYIVRKYIKKG